MLRLLFPFQTASFSLFHFFSSSQLLWLVAFFQSGVSFACHKVVVAAFTLSVAGLRVDLFTHVEIDAAHGNMCRPQNGILRKKILQGGPPPSSSISSLLHDDDIKELLVKIQEITAIRWIRNLAFVETDSPPSSTTSFFSQVLLMDSFCLYDGIVATQTDVTLDIQVVKGWQRSRHEFNECASLVRGFGNGKKQTWTVLISHHQQCH